MQGRPGSTILLVILGGVLLLPGLCALATGIGLGVGGAIGARDLPMLLPLWIACFLIAWGGVHLIRKALR
jgi:hypothetical protein